MADPEASPPSLGDTINLTLKHASTVHTFTFPSSATLFDLSQHISAQLSIPESNQKLLIFPRPGLLKPPFSTTILLSSVVTGKITLLGSTAAQISSLNSSIETSKVQTQRRVYSGPIKPAAPARTRDWKTLHDDTTYTFMQCRPLPYLPRPERSLQYLERLRDDPGIKYSMRKHQWSVPLLTEMNPAEHTTHESKTLGLNRNGGEVIELRLRTDSYDGYRDYKTIRKTLCHELAHNVHGEHDKHFWKLCGEIEKEVEKGDWKSGGHALSTEEFYEPSGAHITYGGDDEVHDHGSWSGGEFVLGGSGSGSEPGPPLSRRGVMAKAAEERMKKVAKNDGEET
jgi:hypothetical protein